LFKPLDSREKGPHGSLLSFSGEEMHELDTGKGIRKVSYVAYVQSSHSLTHNKIPEATMIERIHTNIYSPAVTLAPASPHHTKVK
jgi:hypothetical protein